jgi:hypothetical protein
MRYFNYIAYASLNRRIICLETGFFGEKGLYSDLFILGFLFIFYGIACVFIGCIVCLM